MCFFPLDIVSASMPKGQIVSFLLLLVSQSLYLLGADEREKKRKLFSLHSRYIDPFPINKALVHRTFAFRRIQKVRNFLPVLCVYENTRNKIAKKNNRCSRYINFFKL